MLVYSNHVSLKFSALGPLTPVSNIRFLRIWSRSFWLGRGRSRHNPSKLLSSMNPKSSYFKIVGQQSGDGLDEVLGAMAHFGTRGGVFLNRRSSARQLSRIPIPTRDTVAACIISCKRPWTCFSIGSEQGFLIDSSNGFDSLIPRHTRSQSAAMTPSLD